MCLGMLPECLDRYYICVLPVEARRRVSDPLELELQMVVPPHSGWELNPGPLPPHSSLLNHPLVLSLRFYNDVKLRISENYFFLIFNSRN